MRRLLLIGLVTIGHAALAKNLPVPPIPPAQPPSNDAAPVPNPDAAAPASIESGEPTLAVTLYRARSFDPSVGFAPGSRYQSSEDRKPIQTPGISITVPLK